MALAVLCPYPWIFGSHLIWIKTLFFEVWHEIKERAYKRRNLSNGQCSISSISYFISCCLCCVCLSGLEFTYTTIRSPLSLESSIPLASIPELLSADTKISRCRIAFDVDRTQIRAISGNLNGGRSVLRVGHLAFCNAISKSSAYLEHSSLSGGITISVTSEFENSLKRFVRDSIFLGVNRRGALCLSISTAARSMLAARSFACPAAWRASPASLLSAALFLSKICCDLWPPQNSTTSPSTTNAKANVSTSSFLGRINFIKTARIHRNPSSSSRCNFLYFLSIAHFTSSSEPSPIIPIITTTIPIVAMDSQKISQKESETVIHNHYKVMSVVDEIASFVLLIILWVFLWMVWRISSKKIDFS